MTHDQIVRFLVGFIAIILIFVLFLYAELYDWLKRIDTAKEKTDNQC